MPHKTLFTQADERFELHRWRTEDKRRCLTPRALKFRDPGSASLERAHGETSELQTAKDARTTVAAQAAPRSQTLGQATKIRGAWTRHASRCEPRALGARRSGGVPPLLGHQPRRFGNRCTHPENATHSRGARVRHNPSLNHRTRYGGPSWPGLRYAVHFRSPGQAIPPHRAG